MLVQGDARQLPLQDGCVQTVVTSPPYWGLRDYGHAGQIGLEQTPEEYVQRLVEVFREVRRVLRDDGTVWLNLGDSYASNAATSQNPAKVSGGFESYRGSDTPTLNTDKQGRIAYRGNGIKGKDLIGIPWRVAFALQADGWFLRSDIIWSKPNPMPESVTDRPTKAHEYVFLLTKRERYYYDFEGVKEPATNTRKPGRKITDTRTTYGMGGGNAGLNGMMARYHDGTAPTTRNRRSVWTITTKPYAGAHFATFPPELVEPCVIAGTPEGGCCAACRTPFRRLIEKGAPNREQQAACGADAAGGYTGQAQKDYASANAQDPSATKARILAGMVERRTVGWQPQCRCGAPAVPSLVLDPFVGSGTVVAVAERLGRRGVGVELKGAYLALAQERVAGGRIVQGTLHDPGPPTVIRRPQFLEPIVESPPATRPSFLRRFR